MIDAHLLDRHAHALGHDLADDGFRALALLGDAGRRHHRAVGIDAHGAAVLRRDARAADAVHEGAGVGELDEARKADAAMDALGAQPLLLGAQGRVVDHVQQLVERGLVRQALELHAGGRRARVGAVLHQVAAAELDRIQASASAARSTRPSVTARGDRVADGAVLAGRRLVLEHHRGLGAVVGKVVRAADQVHDLVALHRAGARIDRIGADARQIIDIDGGDAALGIDGHAPLDAVVAGVDVGGEALQPVGNELDGPAHDLGDDGHRHLVGIDVHLDAVAAADVGADHAHVALGQAHVLGEHALHHVRRLGGVIDGELARGAVVVGQDRARLQRHAGVPAGVEGRLDDLVRGGESLLHLAALVDALEAQVVAELGMDDRCVRAPAPSPCRPPRAAARSRHRPWRRRPRRRRASRPPPRRPPRRPRWRARAAAAAAAPTSCP